MLQFTFPLICQVHDQWNQHSELTSQDLSRQHEYLRTNVLQHPQNIIRQGRDLYRKLQIDADSGFTRQSASVSDATTYTLDHVVTMNSVKRMVEHLENKLDKITEMWLDKERHVGRKTMFADLEVAMKTVS